MAEYCFECFKEVHGPKKLLRKNVTFSNYPELCEGCRQYRLVVAYPSPAPFWKRLRPEYKEGYIEPKVDF